MNGIESEEGKLKAIGDAPINFSDFKTLLETLMAEFPQVSSCNILAK